ncbi:hypothetical protein MW290_28550 [Aquincola tertiaricarbonis]|uniref:Asl1-like glycosyl hydrolase catalytic domain-containing protein n=1 Tax=Aquincola tertiaricarbonis TaxID=391953 RepID=A0ABY4SBG2_AQUTE|nr:hypothetical protein [Aquincola tertiaricarbonis]URI09510.1 hypothetical protein MW290_28550 [Aquincola tertiaricarbonis]
MASKTAVDFCWVANRALNAETVRNEGRIGMSDRADIDRVRRAITIAPLAAIAANALSAPATSDFVLGLGLSVNDRPLPRAVELATALGAKSLRIDVPWAQVETSRGMYQIPAWLKDCLSKAAERNASVLLILAYGNPLYGVGKPLTPESRRAFGEYARFVFTQLKGRVAYYDLWNEWNTHTGGAPGASAADYIQLASVVAPIAAAVDPSIRLLSGGISDLGIGRDWLKEFVGGGGLRYFHGVSIHPYNWFYKGNRTPEGAESILDEVSSTMKLDKQRGSTTPIFVTEVGWPAFEGRFGRAEDEVAEFMWRFIFLAASREQIKGCWWYCLRDQGNDPSNKEHRFGLLSSSYEQKPIASKFASLAALLKQGRPKVIRQGDDIQAGWANSKQAFSWRGSAEGPSGRLREIPMLTHTR